MRPLARLLLVAATIATAAGAACPPADGDPLRDLRAWSDQAIVRITTLGTPECTGTGTGFFIGPDGHVLTAGHVVPSQCDPASTAINVRWSTQPHSPVLSPPHAAKVVHRSSLDLAIVKLSTPAPAGRQFLRVAKAADPGSFRHKCVLLASHDPDQTDTYSTFAEIASVALNDGGWSLSGEGFNHGRSGSPVILGDGTVVAVFLSRPVANPDDRARVVQSRARIVPLSQANPEMGLDKIATTTGPLPPFLTIAGTDPGSTSKYINTAFGLSMTQAGFITGTSEPTYLLRGSGELVRAKSLQEAGFRALFEGSSIVRRRDVSRRFGADVGYKFDITHTPRFSVASQNPRTAGLPDRPCTNAGDSNCYEYSTDAKHVELRFQMFSGVDGRRGWFDGQIHLRQIRQ